MKKTIMLATGAILAAGFAATEAQAVDVELYGQVNKGILHVDNDDNGSETSIVDNDRSSSRIGVKGEQQLDNGLTASVLFEFQSESNSSFDVNATDNDTATNDSASLQERHARVGLAGNFGAIMLGKTSGVTDDIMEIDLGGAGDVMGNSIDEYAGSANLDTGITFTDAYGTFDGGRSNVVVYMTPVVNGFQAGAHIDEVGNIAGALRFSGKMDAYQVAAGVAYETVNAADSLDTAEDRILASASVLHDSGLHLSVAHGIESYETTGRDDATHSYIKGGYTMGNLELAADYAITEGKSADDDEVTSYGLAAQYNLGNGVSVAGLYRTVEFDNADTTTEQDLDMFLANLRVKF